MSDTNHVSVCSCLVTSLGDVKDLDPHCPIHGTPLECVTVSSEQKGEELAKRHADELAKGLVDAIVPSIMAKCAEEFDARFIQESVDCHVCYCEHDNGHEESKLTYIDCLECQKNWIKNWRPE